MATPALPSSTGRKVHELFEERISDRQQEKINEAVLISSDDFLMSDLARALNADFTARVDPTIGLFTKIGQNEPCPCGSGRKFKKCCGHSGQEA